MAAIGTAWAAAAWIEASWITEAWSDATSANFSVTRFNTDSGPLLQVIAALETQLETIDDGKALHLIDIERLNIGSYRGTIIYDT